MSTPIARLIPLSAESPAVNMAIDQAILESVDQGAGPTLRFYGWSEPSLSLGYFQSCRDRSKHSLSQHLALVRRATGGGAIVHHCELTYSLAWPLAQPTAASKIALYRQVHQAIGFALADFSVLLVRHGDQMVVADDFAREQHTTLKAEEPFLCFQRRTAEDLILSGYKMVGSAQRTSRRAVLQHGSILLDASPNARELPGMNDLTGRSLSADELAGRIAHHLKSMHGNPWVVGAINSSQRDRAAEIAEERFANPSWNLKR